jgi:hypothetical protein
MISNKGATTPSRRNNMYISMFRSFAFARWTIITGFAMPPVAATVVGFGLTEVLLGLAVVEVAFVVEPESTPFVGTGGSTCETAVAFAGCIAADVGVDAEVGVDADVAVGVGVGVGVEVGKISTLTPGNRPISISIFELIA